MKKTLMYLLVILLALVIIAPVAFGSDSIQTSNHIYTVAIDPSGNMRLLGPDLNGKYNNQPRPNEYVIEIASLDSLLDLQSMLIALQDEVDDLQNGLIELEEIVANLAIGNTITPPVLEIATHSGDNPPIDPGNHNNVDWVQLESGLWVMELDGFSSYIDFGDPESLNISDNITIMAWINIAELRNYSAIVSHEWEPVLWIYNNDKIRFDIDRGGGNRTFAEASNSLSSNTWYQVVGTYSSSSGSNAIKLYINGVLENSGGAINGEMNPSANWNVGRHSVQNGTNLDGTIALVRIYDYALTEEQVLYQFNQERDLLGI